jgi:hypothetical protein
MDQQPRPLFRRCSSLLLPLITRCFLAVILLFYLDPNGENIRNTKALRRATGHKTR